MTAALAELVIVRPGVYDMPAELYHADPVAGGSLSSSGARAMLPPGCPARYMYDRQHPPAPRKTFDLGHAAHHLVLGVGPELVRIDADRWQSNAVKAEVADVRERGGVPLKPAEYEQVHAMAAALRDHREASTLFSPDRGKPEQTLVWQDHRTGVWCRARLDWLPTRPTARVIVPEYKTAESAEPAAFRQAMARYGYHMQAAWNLAGVMALGLAAEAAFVFVVQEKDPPYLVTVAQPDPNAMRIGQARNSWALSLYRDCVDDGRWPGYSDDVVMVPLPAWAEADYEREVNPW